jgi:O-acetylserine/cysteine efflux transporter
MLAPCTGVLSSALVFGEAFAPIRYAGMALVLVGLAIVVLYRGDQRAAARLLGAR